MFCRLEHSCAFIYWLILDHPPSYRGTLLYCRYPYLIRHIDIVPKERDCPWIQENFPVLVRIQQFGGLTTFPFHDIYHTFMHLMFFYPNRKKKMEKSSVPFHHLRTSLSSQVLALDRSMRSPSTLWRTTRGDPRHLEESPPVSPNWWPNKSSNCQPVWHPVMHQLQNIWRKFLQFPDITDFFTSSELCLHSQCRYTKSVVGTKRLI